MSTGNLREDLAALEHYQWAEWTSHMLTTLGLLKPDQSQQVIEDENVKRWLRQIMTPYKHLSEKEKDSDRVWADKVIKLLEYHHG